MVPSSAPRNTALQRPASIHMTSERENWFNGMEASTEGCESPVKVDSEESEEDEALKVLVYETLHCWRCSASKGVVCVWLVLEKSAMCEAVGATIITQDEVKVGGGKS
jgi:hypothetical protein